MGDGGFGLFHSHLRRRNGRPRQGALDRQVGIWWLIRLQKCHGQWSVGNMMHQLDSHMTKSSGILNV